MPKDGFMQGLEKSVAKKMRGRSEDDPKFKWWKDGNKTASESFARKNMPPKGFKLMHESTSSSGEKMVRAYKPRPSDKGNPFAERGGKLPSGTGRKAMNEQYRQSVSAESGQQVTGSKYNRRGQERKIALVGEKGAPWRRSPRYVGKKSGRKRMTDAEFMFGDK
jgi:hypothetical protein